MIMSWIWTGMVAVSLLFSVLTDHGSALAAAVAQGAQTGITLAISISGSICLWCGVGKLMDTAGLTEKLAKVFSPLLRRIFPTTKHNKQAAMHLSANICANLLGLGNAATPMGIQAAKALRSKTDPSLATNEMCRLIVLNTASIQLIPANVAAVRASLGCATPFDILPAVWLTSLCSASMGLIAAFLLGKVWKQ